MPYGTGRSAPGAPAIVDMLRHRRAQLVALQAKARRDDQTKRELAEVERDLADDGERVIAMTDAERRFFARDLQHRIEATEAEGARLEANG